MKLDKLTNEILSAYPYRIELHAHSHPVSLCSDVSPQELVDIYHKAGFDALALTNHFLSDLLRRGGAGAMMKAYEAAKAQAEKYGMMVYLAAEVRFDENCNDYLLYGVDEEILERTAEFFEQGLEAFVKNGKDERSVLVQAHPFRSNMELMDASLLDGFEVHNMHAGHNSRPAVALHHAADHHARILTAGTDFHHPTRQVPTAAMRVKKLPKDSFALAKLLKEGDYCFEAAGRIILLP